MVDNTQRLQTLVDEILGAGQELLADGMEKTSELSARGKQLAGKGEDVLLERLKLEDTAATREALRKGLGAGAAAGGLALLLSSRSGRKLAALGGLSGLGMLAYKAYQRNGGEMPDWKNQVAGLISGPKAETRAGGLLRAMVAAAKADGKIDDEEMLLIQQVAPDGKAMLDKILKQPPNPLAIARLADSPQAAREIYAVSCRVADGISMVERDYLDDLARALDLNPELAAEIETDVRIG